MIFLILFIYLDFYGILYIMFYRIVKFIIGNISFIEDCDKEV